MAKHKRKTAIRGWCWDCEKDVDQKIVIPICAENRTGLKMKPGAHGNNDECSDEYCRVTDFVERDYTGSLPLSKYEDYRYRCPECDTLNVELNGNGRPKKNKQTALKT